MDNQKNIVALTENELENISGGRKESSFQKGFKKALGKFCAGLVIAAPFLIITGLCAAAADVRCYHR